MSPNHLSNVFGIVAAALVAGALVADLRSDVRRLARARNVVLAGILAWFLLEAVTLSPALRLFSQETYHVGVLCVLLSAASFLFGYHQTQGCKLVDGVAGRVRQLDDPRILWTVVVVCAVLGLAPVAYYSGLQLYDLFKGILGMRRSWGGLIGRGRYGGFREAVLQLENFVFGAGPFAVILLLSRRCNVPQRIFCGVIALWPLLRAYGSGTRSTMIAALLPVVAIVYFRSRPRTQRAMILGTLAMSPLIYLFMAAIIGSREKGGLEWEAAQRVDYVGNEMFQELLYVIDTVPDKVEYQLGHSYYVQLVNPIPRFLWPGKPTLDTGILLAQMKGAVDPNNGEVYFTNSPGLIGEMYLNFGVLGILGLSAFGGWLARGWDRIPRSHAASLPTMVFYAGGLGSFFILGRSFTMNMFYAMGFLFVGITVITALKGRRAGVAMPATHRRLRRYGGV